MVREREMRFERPCNMKPIFYLAMLIFAGCPSPDTDTDEPEDSDLADTWKGTLTCPDS
jgi:hypothetical protein